MESFTTPRRAVRGFALGPEYGVAPIEYWHFQRHFDFWRWAETQPPRRVRALLGLRDGHKLFFSESIAHDSVSGFLSDSERFDPGLRVDYYNGDRLRVRLVAPTAGHLSFIDNWDPDWQVFVDGQERAIDLLFGTFKAVAVPAGPHQVEFAYRPTFVGWRLNSLELRRPQWAGHLVPRAKQSRWARRQSGDFAH